MPNINWKELWDDILKGTDIFPIKVVKGSTVTISCPTRFSDTGELAIDITPSFNNDSIEFEILMFNDNVSMDDLNIDTSKMSNRDRFNRLAKSLVDYELSNRILDRFTIKSDGFSSDEEAKKAIIDYINNKATESGRMFDDKLDELNDAAESTKVESYNSNHSLESIKNNRKCIFKKVEGILRNNYGWKPLKNEEFSDSVTSFYDDSNNLVAVVSLADGNLIVDLAKNITAKVSMLQSDEDIENELVSDIDNAEELLADKEVAQLKDIVSADSSVDEFEDYSYYDRLERKVAKLESLYIKKCLRRFN